MRFRLLAVLLLLLTTACTKEDEKAAKPESNSENVATRTEPSAADVSAAKKKAEAEAARAEAEAEAARAEAEAEAAKRLAEATEKFKALNDELDAEMKAYALARQKVSSREEAMELAKKNPLLEFGPQFVEFAKKFAGTDESKEAIVMIATRGSGDSKNEAVELMIKDYVDDDKLAEFVSTMSRGMPSPQNEKWLDQIFENTSNAKIKGRALVAKAGLIDSIASLKGAIAGATEQELATVDKEIIEFVNAERNVDEDLDELVGLMEAFVKEHSAEASIVERELFGLKYLRIGCEAPEIAGIDLDDKDFKLSDYRGKVVLLDFWGDW